MARWLEATCDRLVEMYGVLIVPFCETPIYKRSSVTLVVSFSRSSVVLKSLINDIQLFLRGVEEFLSLSAV